MVNPKVALVHDDLIQWGGAERVLLALAEIFPHAPIYTSIFNDQNELLRQKFQGRRIKTSFLQKVPGRVKLYRALLPFYSLAFEQFDFSSFDVVISQTTRFAKSVVTKPGTLHISYVHTPPRFLWNFSGVRPPKLQWLLSLLRVEDLILSRRPDIFWAGSQNARRRISKVYRRQSEVLYPFVDLEAASLVPGFDGGYYLTISRMVGYKRVDLVVEAFNQTGKRLKIVGAGPNLGPLIRRARPNIEFLGSIPDNLLLNLIAGCRGVIIAGEEDFGLMPLEAQAVGKGVIAYGRGGTLETVVDGKTGVLFADPTPDSLIKAVKRFEQLRINEVDCRENARRFSKERFRHRVLGLLEVLE